MMISNKDVSNVNRIIEEIIDLYKEQTVDSPRDWRTYEERVAFRIRKAMEELEPLINEAVSTIRIVRDDPRGRHADLSLKQKTSLLLLKHLFQRSNREMSAMLVVFSLLSGIDVSYKTVERLYSDENVTLVLHNLHQLLLKKKGVQTANTTGDGTGYTLTIKKHYATETSTRKEKAKKSTKTMKFAYRFRLMDLDTRMYLASGASFRSENDAYLKAMTMAKELHIELESIRLDKYYSGQSRIKFLTEQFDGITIYVLPKKNSTIRGSTAWKKMLYHYTTDPHGYLEEYYRRNQSESGFSEDKRRMGWKIAQQLPERIDTAETLTTLWHNLFWLN